MISFPVVDLACCCPRAPTTTFTGEACLEIARANGLKTQEFVRAISAANLLPDKEILARSSFFWPRVAHPLILAQEIMES